MNSTSAGHSQNSNVNQKFVDSGKLIPAKLPGQVNQQFQGLNSQRSDYMNSPGRMSQVSSNTNFSQAQNLNVSVNLKAPQ